MFIQIVPINNMSHPIAWLNKFDSASTSKKVEGDRILEFVTLEDSLKTPYLYDKDNYKIIADGQIYSVLEVTSIVQSGEENKVQVEAEHYSYSLNENTFDLYESNGTVYDLMNDALYGTNFVFYQTDIPISEVKTLKILFTNSRYLINRIAREFKAKITYDNDKISLFRSFSNATGIRLTIEKNLHSIQRKVSYKEGVESITYEIDVVESNLEALEHVDLGDALIVLDEARGNTPVDRVVVEVTKDLLTGKVIDLVLGDPNPKFSDAILDLVMPPIIEEVEEMLNNLPENIITEVIHQQVINVETAHILNAWIKNLFVESVETNMDDRLNRTTVDRYFITMENERIDWKYQKLSPTQTEELLVKDPNGSGNLINVYFTAIGNHPDAYRYFTITNPKIIHKDLTDAEVNAFKVMVKKVESEGIKKSILFTEHTTPSGIQTVAPLDVWGEGSEAFNKFGERRGQAIDLKDSVGKTYKQNLENNDGYVGLRLNALLGIIEWHNPLTKKWEPFTNNKVGGAGAVIFHQDKTELALTDLVSANALHIGYSSTTKLIGEYSECYTTGLALLGAEVQTQIPPFVPLPGSDEIDNLIVDWTNGYGGYITSDLNGNVFSFNNTSKRLVKISYTGEVLLEGILSFDVLTPNEGLECIGIQHSESLYIGFGYASSAEGSRQMYFDLFEINTDTMSTSRLFRYNNGTNAYTKLFAFNPKNNTVAIAQGIFDISTNKRLLFAITGIDVKYDATSNAFYALHAYSNTTTIYKYYGDGTGEAYKQTFPFITTRLALGNNNIVAALYSTGAKLRTSYKNSGESVSQTDILPTSVGIGAVCMDTLDNSYCVTYDTTNKSYRMRKYNANLDTYIESLNNIPQINTVNNFNKYSCLDGVGGLYYIDINNNLVRIK